MTPWWMPMFIWNSVYGADGVIHGTYLLLPRDISSSLMRNGGQGKWCCMLGKGCFYLTLHSNWKCKASKDTIIAKRRGKKHKKLGGRMTPTIVQRRPKEDPSEGDMLGGLSIVTELVPSALMGSYVWTSSGPYKYPHARFFFFFVKICNKHLPATSL